MTKEELAFSSFFMGEGMIRTSFEQRKAGNRKCKNYGKKKKPYFRQLVRITLRNDDSDIVDWILRIVGGHCFNREKRDKIWNKQTGKYTFSNPTIIWQAEDLDTCERVANLLVQNPIPSKKKEEAKVFLEYVKIKRETYKSGIGYPEEVLEKFEHIYDKLKQLKKYKEK